MWRFSRRKRRTESAVVDPFSPEELDIYERRYEAHVSAHIDAWLERQRSPKGDVQVRSL